MVHAKTMLVDGRIGLVGSANLDNRSFRLNFEVSMIFYDEKALAKLDELFEADKHKCRHITMKSRAKIAAADAARRGERAAALAALVNQCIVRLKTMIPTAATTTSKIAETTTIMPCRRFLAPSNGMMETRPVGLD